MKYTDFLELRSLIKVAHHIPGRIRLKFSPDILSHPAAPFLKDLATNSEVQEKLVDKGFINATPNLMARSLVLEYETSRIAPQTLDTFFNGKDIDEVTQLAMQVAALLNINLHP